MRLKIFIYIILSIFFSSCISITCREDFDMKDGKMEDNYFRALTVIVKENDEPAYISLMYFKPSIGNDGNFINENGIVFNHISLKGVFLNTNDTLEYYRESKELLSCKNFKHILEENEELYIEIEYQIDSAGFKRNFKKEYHLYKETNCHAKFRVH